MSKRALSDNIKPLIVILVVILIISLYFSIRLVHLSYLAISAEKLFNPSKYTIFIFGSKDCPFSEQMVFFAKENFGSYYYFDVADSNTNEKYKKIYNNLKDFVTSSSSTVHTLYPISVVIDRNNNLVFVFSGYPTYEGWISMYEKYIKSRKTPIYRNKLENKLYEMSATQIEFIRNLNLF